MKRRRVPPPALPSTASGSSAAAATCPPHPAFLMDICVRCGARREKGSATEASAPATTSMRYIHEGLELSNAELDRAKREERARVLRSGKLLLVLDLDHTLLNSARFSDLSQAQHNALGMVILARAAERSGHSQEEIDTLVKNIATEIAERAKARAEARAKSDSREDADVPPAARSMWPPRPRLPFRPGCSPPLKHLHCLQHLALFTKLRPHVHEFLAAASRLCQLYIYTMGDKNYAARWRSSWTPRASSSPAASSPTTTARARTPRTSTSCWERSPRCSSWTTPIASGRTSRQSDSRRSVPFFPQAPRDSASRVAR